MLKSMTNGTSYALWKWRRWFAKNEHNNLVCVLEFKLFVNFSITFHIKKNCNSPLGASKIIKISQFDKEMKKICSFKVKWGDSSTN
jgi:hypothetical protein